MANRSTSNEPLVALVEDEPFVREFAACELQECGYKVIEFPSADEALPWLESHGGELEVLVTDVQMPGVLDGLQLAAISNRLWPSLAVVVTSGGALVDPSRLPPSARFFAKPWRPADLVARVRKIAASQAAKSRS